jgi:PiT family inorganic phosphate transporter
MGHFHLVVALPTSSSHAIISGFAGAAIAKAGFKALLLKGWVPVVTFLVVSPIFGFILAYILMVAVTWMSHKTPRHKAESIFRKLQLVSAGAYSLGHGTNDAQKTMGIIVALLLAAGKKDWVSGSTFLGRHQEIVLVDHSELPRRHRPGYALRWLANCKDHGVAYHSALASHWRVLC